jgi:hypothetical protein
MNTDWLNVFFAEHGSELTAEQRARIRQRTEEMARLVAENPQAHIDGEVETILSL